MVSKAPPGAIAAPVVLEADERNLGSSNTADLAPSNRPDLGSNFGELLPYNSGVHSLVSPLWAGSRGVPTTRGAVFF
jgi:hypothetical protein